MVITKPKIEAEIKRKSFECERIILKDGRLIIAINI